VAKRSLPLSEVYRLIEPGLVVLVSTMSGGRANIMTMSWQMMVDFRAADSGLRYEQPGLFVSRAEEDQRMRRQHPHGRAGPKR